MARTRRSTLSKFRRLFGLGRIDDLAQLRRQLAKTQRARPRLEQLEDRTLPTARILVSGIPDWVEQGPGPIHGGQVVGMAPQNNPVVGAVEAIAVHPSDPNIIYIGAVNGGVWKTTNAATAPSGTGPTWTPLTDQYPSLAISALVISPLNTNTIYAGTGRLSSGNAGGQGIGLLKTENGGATWTVLGAEHFAGLNIRRVVSTRFTSPPSSCDAGEILLVAVVDPADSSTDVTDRGGLFRSLDGGASWKRLSGFSGTGLPLGSVTHVVADPDLGSCRLYAAVSGDFDRGRLNATTGRPENLGDTRDNDSIPWSNKGIYASDNGGRSWQRITSGLVMPQDSDGLDNDQDGLTDAMDPQEGLQLSVRMEVAVSRTPGNPIYAAIIVPGPFGGELGGLFRSTNQGSPWTAMDLPQTRGEQRTITGATNPPAPAPIVITTSANHGYVTGDRVRIAGVLGNTNANGHWTITVNNMMPNQFSLNGSTGNGAYTGGGTVGSVFGLNPSGQGDYHFSIAAHPTDPNLVYLGGDSHNNQSTRPVGATNATAVLFRGDASAPRDNPVTLPNLPFPQWSPLTDFGTLYGSAPHADSRELVFDGAGNLLEADDGGIYRHPNPHSGRVRSASRTNPIVIGSTNHGRTTDQQVRIAGVTGNTNANGIFTITVIDPNSFSLNGTMENGDYAGGGIWSIGDWASLNGNLRITEMNSIAYDARNDVLLSGNQDTGAAEQTNGSNRTWQQIHQADGFFQAVDSSGPTVIRYSLGNNFTLFERRRFSSANVQLNPIFHPITGATNASPIVITSNGHGLSDGTRIRIRNVEGNTAANGSFAITRVDDNQFSLNGSTGNYPYRAGGDWRRASLITDVRGARGTRVVITSAAHRLNSGDQIRVTQLDGNTGLNGNNYHVTVLDDDRFSLNGTRADAGGRQHDHGGLLAVLQRRHAEAADRGPERERPEHA